MIPKMNMNKFAALCGLVKNIKRAGWLRYLPSQKVQSVGDHTAKIAFLTFALRGVSNVDYQKCMQFAILHDIAQGIVGDITPYDKVSKQQKYQRQLKAVQQIFQPLQQNKQYFLNRWIQFQKKQCIQSLLVHDLDKLQMIQQAFFYQKKQNVDLSQFYQCVKNMKTQIVRQWGQELIQERQAYFLNNNKNNKKKQ